MEDGSVARGYQRPLSDWGNPDDPSFKRKPLYAIGNVGNASNLSQRKF